MRGAGLALLAASLLGFAAPADASPGNPTVLPDCLGRPQFQPADVVLACGDGNAVVSSIRWTGWGSAFTAGRGTATIDDCKPNCAQGTGRTYPVVLLATGKQACGPGGPVAYLTLTIAFLDRRPHISGSETFRCRTR